MVGGAILVVTLLISHLYEREVPQRLHFDLADHILNQEILGSTRISNNLLFSAGVGIWIPFRIRS